MRRLGFSLLELSVVLVVVGLLAGLALSFKQSAGGVDCVGATKTQLETINTAVKRFISANDRLPIPALRTVGVEDPQYGREANLAALDTDASGKVVYGALPFQVLGLAPSYAGDCWGNKFTYAATIALTDKTNFLQPIPNEIYGVIQVKTSASTVVNTTAAYAVVSHGLNGMGAVKTNYAGSNAKWCTLGSGSGIESENCETSNAVVMAAPYNDGKDAGAALFDDVVTFSGKPERSVNGVCDNTVPLGCAPGIADNPSPSPVNGQVCGTTRTWDCNGAHGGTNATGCSYTYPICLGCSAQSLSWGGGCVGDFPAAGHGTTTPIVTNNNTSFTGNATATCDNGSFSASGTCTPLPPVVNGVCDTAVALGCSGGAPISDNGQTNCGTTRSWVCAGSNGGTNSGTCTKANDSCQSCAATTLGWGGGCVGNFPPTAHGATTPSVTNSNSLYSGSATASCSNGSFSTPAGPCAPLVAEDGVCDSGTAGACAAGTPTGDDGATACGTTRHWTCQGRNGGANSPQCTKANDPCGGLCAPGLYCHPAFGPAGYTLPAGTPGQVIWLNQAHTAGVECYAAYGWVFGQGGSGNGGGGSGGSNLGSPQASCSTGCSARTENWTVGADSCSGNTPPMADGQSGLIVSNIANGKSGSVTMSCSGGVLSQSGGMCSSDPCAGRGAAWKLRQGSSSIGNNTTGDPWFTAAKNDFGSRMNATYGQYRSTSAGYVDFIPSINNYSITDSANLPACSSSGANVNGYMGLYSCGYSGCGGSETKWTCSCN